MKLKWVLSWQDKKKIETCAMEVIDIMRKKHKLSPLECCVLLDNLKASLQDTMSELWKSDTKS